MTLELLPDELARVEAAAKRTRSAPRQVLHNLIVEHLPTEEKEESDPTLALFEQWDREDAERTDEEAARETEFWSDFKESLNGVRRAASLREL